MVKASASVRSVKKKTKPSGQSLKPESQEHVARKEVNYDDLSEITVSIDGYQNIFPVYPSSNVFARCFFLDKYLGETAKTLLTDDPINISNEQFKFECDPTSPQDLDHLVSSPMMIKVYQLPVKDSDSKIVSDISKPSEGTEVRLDSIPSVESVISLYEALTGDVVEVTEPLHSKKGKKSKDKLKGGKKKKGSKTSQGKLSRDSSKESKKSKKSLDKKSPKSKKESSKEALKKPKSEESETLIGSCVVDLLPLIFGKSSYTEQVPIIPAQIFCDDRMPTYKRKPGLDLTVSIDKAMEFVCKPDILSITVESIYNLPAIMNEDMDYHVCMMLPSVDLAKEPLLVKNGEFTTSPDKPQQRKYWPDLPKDYSNVTTYLLDQDPDSVKNYVTGLDLHKTLTNDRPRIQFDCIKRNLLLKDGFFALGDQVRKFQKVILEIHAFKKVPDGGKGSGELTNRSKASKTSKTKMKEKSGSDIIAGEDKKEKPTKPTSYLHLMATIDLSALLYPGTTKIRLATPLTTFHQGEAVFLAGLEKSYFFPQESRPQLVSPRQPSKTKAGKKSEKKSSSKSSIGSKKGKKKKGDSKSSTGSKGGKKKKGKGGQHSEEKDLNLQSALPPGPVSVPPPEPSIKVYNEEGEPTFIILEIELTRPLMEKKSIDDLHRGLQKLVHEKPQTPKAFFDNKMATDYYTAALKKIISEINNQYVIYSQAKNHCFCESKADFLTYLKRIGAYQKFVAVLIQIASILAQSKLNMIEEAHNQQHYQKIVEEIFRQLITEVNQVLHGMTMMSRSIAKYPKTSTDSLLFYAKEATEIRDVNLAERYYLERLYHDSDNPDFWFDYAVFKMECNQFQKSFMCLQEALSRKMYHKNSLLMYGVILAEKGQLVEAETCLLTLMVQEPRWPEGWIVLYLFYKDRDNTGGMDMAQEMALKYLGDPRSSEDEWMKTEELVWTSNLCPNTMFFRAAVILLKMRLFSWTENALAYELKEPGIVHYMLAVICYYKKDYGHALQHLARARYFHGSDIAVASLAGHCQLAMGNSKDASEEYLYILESFLEVEYTHLLHINCARAIEDVHKARKLLLIACKQSPTPYTWLSCGIMYFKQNDLMSAEECFSEAVILDNLFPDCWGYLTLINLKMYRSSEAELCYSLALKNNLTNEFLLEEIKKGFEKLTQT